MATLTPAIVGRVTELETIERFLDELGSSASALVIEGEAGIGKTTVWREGVAGAERRSYRVLRAQPAESESTLSYAALADLIGAVFDEARTALPPPQQRGLEAALLRADPDETTDPRTTATGLLSVLEALTGDSPVVVAIDDVQWLDPASARALEFAARRLPATVVLLLSRRTETGVARQHGPELALPPGQLVRVPIGPLSLAALHHVIAGRLGGVPSRLTLVRLATASAGNPFYALEIAQALGHRSAGQGLGDPLPVPPHLHALVAARLDALSPEARQAVLVAATLSRPTKDAVLGQLEQGAAGLFEAEQAGIVTEEGGRLRFTHPLLASAVYGAASAEQRRAVHRGLAESTADSEERARHVAQSEVDPDEPIAAELELAAQHAARRGAQDAAAEIYDAAYRLTPVGLTRERSCRLLGEASALLAAGELGRARSVAETAVTDAPPGTLRAESLFLLSQIAWVDSTATAVEQLERALVEAGKDRRLRGRIHAKLAAFSMRDQRAAVAHADAAAALLNDDEDPGLLAYALVNSVFFGAQIGLGARPELLDRALRLEEKAGPDAEKSSLFLIWLSCVDDFDAARERHLLEDQWYRDRGEVGWQAEKQAQLAGVELRAGNAPLAERLAEEACATLEQMGPRGAWAIPFAIRARIDAQRGRIERARETLLPIVEEMESTRQLLVRSARLGRARRGRARGGRSDCRGGGVRALGVLARVDRRGLPGRRPNRARSHRGARRDRRARAGTTCARTARAARPPAPSPLDRCDAPTVPRTRDRCRWRSGERTGAAGAGTRDRAAPVRARSNAADARATPAPVEAEARRGAVTRASTGGVRATRRSPMVGTCPIGARPGRLEAQGSR